MTYGPPFNNHSEGIAYAYARLARWEEADIRAQQHAADEAALADMICDTCDCDPCACDDENEPIGIDCDCGRILLRVDIYGDETICANCEERRPYPNDEPTMAGEVTGYDNGPTFW